MKKRILSFLIMLYMITALLPANITVSAYNGTKYGDYGDYLYYRVESNGEVTITDCDELATEIEIPSEIDGQKVTRIGSQAFMNCSNLTSVTIPDSITSIGDMAFCNCNNLTSVYINDLKAYLDIEFGSSDYSVPTYYGHNLYLKNELLTDVVIPDGVESIPDYVFYENENLTSITIPDGVTSIGVSAFCRCGSLTSITIPDSVTKICSNAFGSCTGLTSVTIPNSVTSIGAYAFNDCTNLTSVDLGNGVTSIGGRAFSFCKSLTTVTLPSSLASTGSNSFIYCTGLKSVIIENGITTIDGSSFSNCTSLTDVIIPSSVTKIFDYAFEYCTSLKSITIPESVTYIGTHTFMQSVNIDSVYITDLKAYLNCTYGDSSSGWAQYSNPMYYASKLYINGKRATDIIIPEGVVQIPNYAFSGCSSLTSVSIPDSVKSVGSYAFSNCTGLKSVSFDEGVTTIGSNAFYGCSNMTSVIMPDSVTSIGQWAFRGCSSLKSITMPDSVTNIGQSAFAFSGLTSITIPKNVTSIGESAFYYCSSLKTVIFENCIKKIEKSTFGNCNKLTDITLPDVLETIDENAFYNCSLLAKLTIPHNVSEIEAYAFHNCGDLDIVNYNGNEDDWNNIFIGESNDYLKNATRNYFWYVTIIDEDSEEISKKKYDLNALVDISDIEPKHEHTIHLYTDKACKNEFDFEKTPITKNLTLYLKYVLNQYNAKFINDDGALIREGLVDYGALIIPPQNPTKDRTQKYTYTFREWDRFYEGITQTNSEMVFTAKYDATINKYTYKFLDNDNTVLKDMTVDYGTVITPPETPADKDPYTFDSWDGYASGAELTDDIEFKAVYKYKTYKITAEGLENTVDVVYNDPYELATQEPEEEYLFDGYYTEKDGKGTKVTGKDGKSLKNYDFLNNITVYPYFPHELLNKIKINGESSTVAGSTNVVKKVYFATNKDAQYLLCNIKFPESIEIKEIVPIDFKYVSVESRTVSDGMVYLNLICQYTNNLNSLPINKKLEPFDLVFDIPKNIASQSVSIEVTADSMVIGDEEYSFDSIINGELEIITNPVESIEIIGMETVILENGDVSFTARITPDNGNKEVEWSIDNEEIATISQEGILTPKATGTVVITATAKDGSEISDTKTVNIIGYAKIDTLKINVGQWETAFDPNVREYTVYAPKNATEISFTAGFSSGTLKLVNGNEKHTMMKNKPRTVNIENGETNIVLLKGNVDGCADSEYKIKIVKFEGTKITVSDNGTKFTVTPINIAKDNTVILALYNGNTFVEMQSATYNGEDIPFTTSESYTKVKVFVWSNLTDIMPICDVEIIE